MNSKKEMAGKQLDAIRNFCIIKGVPADLRSRILEYYDYVLTSSATLAEMDIFKNMPPALNAQLNLAVGRRLVSRCSFFRHVSDPSMIVLIADMTPLVFVPKQTIVVKATPLHAVYFINRGMVKLFSRPEKKKGHLNHETVVEKQLSSKSRDEILKDHDNFGIEDYMAAQVQGNPEDATVRQSAMALTYCDMMALATDKLTEELENDDNFQQHVLDCIAKMEERKRNIVNKLKCRMGGASHIKQQSENDSTRHTTIPKVRARFAGCIRRTVTTGRASITRSTHLLMAIGPLRMP